MPLLDLRAGVFQDVKSALDAVRDVDEAVGIDVEVVEHRRLLPFGRRRHEEADFFGTVLVAYVEDAEPRVVVGDEDDVLAVESPGAMLVHVVRPEAEPALAEIPFRDRARADDHGISFLADIDQPDALLALLAVIFDGLVDGDDELPPRQRHGRMRVAAERRARSEEHTSETQSRGLISYAVF